MIKMGCNCKFMIYIQAYTAAATIHGAIFTQTGNKTSRLSAQQLTDCSSDASESNYYGNSGCDGGNVWNGFIKFCFFFINKYII
jgi:hypothetical protein